MDTKICPKAIIFVAMESERDNIVTPALTNLGLTGREDIWVVVTGVGKVRAALTASKTLFLLQLLHGVEAVEKCKCINVGVVGGSELAYKNHPVSRVLVSVNNDFNTSEVTPNFIKDEINLGDGNMTCLTQDHFCMDPSDLPDSGMWYVDMELYSIAAACVSSGAKLTAIKSVSDVIGCSNQEEEYNTNFKYACERASKLLEDELCNHSDVMLK